MAKGAVNRKHMSVPLTVEIEPPKPKVLTKEELHQKIDEMLYVAEYMKDNKSSPVVIYRFQYEALLDGKEFDKKFIAELQTTVSMFRRDCTRLREEVSRLKERIEYMEGKRPLSEIHNENDKISLELDEKRAERERQDAFSGIQRLQLAQRSLPKKNNDHLAEEFSAFLVKERGESDQPST